nr:hypothetical protein [Zavarzinella formosa]
MTNNERDLRLAMLNTLLTTPHRKLEALWGIHDELSRQDPRFYVRLAAWYADKGDVRDHREMFVVSLATSEFPGHRDVGLALLRDLPPYQVGRVVDFISGRKKSRKAVVMAGEAPSPVVEEFGLFRNVPRSLRTEVARYLREREADAEWFDSTVLTARKAVKRLYALLHVKPGERAQKVLFNEEPPSDSRLFALKILAKAENPTAQAKAIVEHGIPYRVAVSVLKQVTPTVLAALIDRMTPQELINNVGSLRRRGATDNADLKALIERKLGEAKTDGRVSAYKASVAAKAADVSPELAKSLTDVTDSQIKSKGKITRSTALLLDKSGSMEVALEVGKQLGALVSAVCEAELFAYAFDNIAYPIEPKGKMVTDWEKALLGIKAGGGTSCGVAIEWMAKQKQRVEQFLFVTDEGENGSPLFSAAYQNYVAATGLKPTVTIVKVGQATEQLEAACKQMNVPYNVFEFRGDYYSLPNVIPLLSQASQTDLLMEILSYPLPVRS